ncbi:MAG: hypothetical protein KDJ75_04235 [Alphaproteobacteria bacterium]|nr:hypothetical protein [Alphaproteobacteria bacterium]
MLGKTLFLSALVFTLLSGVPCRAEESFSAPEAAYGIHESVSVPAAQAETAFAVGASGRELAYEFAGDREEGALRLFLSRESFTKRDKDDILAEELNGLSPAAGIRFTIDFSL